MIKDAEKNNNIIAEMLNTFDIFEVSCYFNATTHTVHQILCNQKRKGFVHFAMVGHINV